MLTVVLSRSRAVRYDFETPVLYRTGGDEWSMGTMLNASASGALISGALPLEADEPVTVMIVLPASGGCLTGCGRITRVSGADPTRNRGTFAIAVPQFSLEHHATALARVKALHQGC